jgi:hypothetical protein
VINNRFKCVANMIAVTRSWHPYCCCRGLIQGDSEISLEEKMWSILDTK